MEGNARYWGLKLILEEFAHGDRIVPVQRRRRNKICAGHSNYPLGGSPFPYTVTIQCPEPGSYISRFGKVDMTDQVGNCDDGWTVVHGNCSDNGRCLPPLSRNSLVESRAN